MRSIFDAWRGIAAICLEYSKDWLTSDPYGVADRLLRGVGMDLHAVAAATSSAKAGSFIADTAQRGRWAASGYPTVCPTHRAAVSWMATNYKAADAALVVAPWPSFVIRIPTGLLWITGGNGEERNITTISASFDRNMWDYSIATDILGDADLENGGINIWAYQVTNPVMLGNAIPSNPVIWHDLEKTGLDERTEMLARRLIVGVCMYYSHQEKLKEFKIAKGGTKKKGGRDSGVLPDYRCWEMTSDISIDVVRAMKEWSRTGVGSSPTVQGMVAGHGKSQPHGPNGSLRKWIHVEPYWRGPEDAPVSDRSGNQRRSHDAEATK